MLKGLGPISQTETQCLALIALGSPHGSTKHAGSNRLTGSLTRVCKTKYQQLNFDKTSESFQCTGQLWKYFSYLVKCPENICSRFERHGSHHRYLCSEKGVSWSYGWRDYGWRDCYRGFPGSRVHRLLYLEAWRDGRVLAPLDVIFMIIRQILITWTSITFFCSWGVLLSTHCGHLYHQMHGNRWSNHCE